jgi:hypothetical protein
MLMVYIFQIISLFFIVHLFGECQKKNIHIQVCTKGLSHKSVQRQCFKLMVKAGICNLQSVDPTVLACKHVMFLYEI